MTALFAGELRRLLARRAGAGAGLLGVLGIDLAGVLTFLNTEDTDPVRVAARRQQVEREFQACQEQLQASGGGPGSGFRERPPEGIPDCFARVGTSGTDDRRFELVDLKGALQGVTAPLVIVAWLLGASAIGADWQSRTLTTLLTWEPRRARVLATKALAAMVVAVLFT